MEAEKVHQEKNNRTPQLVRGGTAQFVDNRPLSFALPLFGIPIQCADKEEELQMETDQTVQKKPNNTGLPDTLKNGIENLSGFSMDNVHVHYNSSRPATVQAFAYTQGTDIHIAPGQERHLPHEAWHVIQQMAGRVQPTTKIGGMSVNDNAELEHEADVMGMYAIQLKSGKSVKEFIPKSTVITEKMPAQRRLNLDNVPPYYRNRTLYKYCIFDNKESFKTYVENKFPLIADWERFWGTPIMENYFTLVEQSQTTTVLYETLATDIEWAIKDAERLDALIPDGPIPKHHEFVTFTDPPAAELHEHSVGPVGYASKMMGKKGERDDFSPLLSGIKTVILTTGDIQDVSRKTGVSAWRSKLNSSFTITGDRRPGLSIINYSTGIFQMHNKLAICGVRGKILMDQFGLAIREYAQARMGNDIEIQTILNTDALHENYSRLLNFFSRYTEFCEIDTIVFGYASAFEHYSSEPGILLSCKVTACGWVASLYKRVDGAFAVFDSDLSHSYHGEILAQNVKLLLENPVGNKIKKVLIGGSAGSLVEPRKKGDTIGEESLIPNRLFIPDAILRPDGFFKKNALRDVNMAGVSDLTVLPGSMHTSVVSVLAETPGVLNDLFEYGVKTVDMEFAYVALVLGEKEPPISPHPDLAGVKLGVACLVTDFPKTGAQGVALAEKDIIAKEATKALFVKTVIASMK